MDSKKPPLETSPEALLKRAGDCIDIAKSQHDLAEQQHMSADKLDQLGHELEAGAIELKGKMQMKAARGRLG